MTGMSRGQFLGHVELLEERRREVEAELLVAAAEWAAMNGPETVDPEEAKKPGRESVRHYGGPGTPYVASFAGAEFGARIDRSTSAGDEFIAAALDLQYRLPQLWHRVQAGEVQASYARHVARRTRELEADQAKYVDSRVAEAADGRVTWSRFESLVDAAIKAADPEAARAREEKRRKLQFTRRVRQTEDGIGGFFIRADVATIRMFDAAVGHFAELLKRIGIDESEEQRRVRAIAVLANPACAVELMAAYAAWKDRPADPKPPADHEDPELLHDQTESEPEGIVAQVLDLVRRWGWEPDGERPTVDWRRLMPRATLFVHTYAGERAGSGLVLKDYTGIARIEGAGPVTDAWVRQYLGPDCQFKICPVLDIEGLAPVDSHEVPDRHRQAVRIMTPADVFPFATATVNRADGWIRAQIDHTVAFRRLPKDEAGEERGRSEIGNYGPLTQRHHNLKTHGGWQVKQPFPGIFVWHDPDGRLYLVDHTGTRRLKTPVSIDSVECESSAEEQAA